VIYPIADLPLASRHRVSQITFHPSHPYLAVQSHDRSVEIFRIRSEDEVRKKQARRKKRAKEKGGTERDHAENATNVEDGMDIKLVDLFTPHIVVRASGKIRSFDFVGSAGGPQVRAIFLLRECSMLTKNLVALRGSRLELSGSIQCSTTLEVQGKTPRSISNIFC
jgi:hypothetical protein